MDLSHSLCSNEPPSPSEIPALRAAFADLLVQQLELQLRLDEIEEKVRQHAAVLSPVRRVPLEILSDIFTLAVFDTRRSEAQWSSKTMYTYPDTREWVVALSLVCRHWRRAALVTRSFWSQVSVDCALNEVVSRHIAYDKVGTWLSHQDVLPRVLEVGRKHFEATCCEHDDLVCRYEDASFGEILAAGPILDKLVLWLQDPECLQNLLNLS
ncbi:hypothetical protein FA13DRAFT_148401 [Coprinellus micaceus]|uniref:Uncharacterized protein n=1 Tax=Coprinellus micaceus TaxID=71717 RepID=A0A4Y7TIN9_COPMI|nr:hypothetical protein FA13DRAFT_148401 [Coprinellus micaceus]